MRTKGRIKQVLESINRIVGTWVEPLAPAGDPFIRRRMQMLASLMLILMLFSAVSLAVIPFTNSRVLSAFGYFRLGLLLLVVPLYFLSRSRWYRTVTFILVVVALLSPVLALQAGGSYAPQNIELALIWLTLGFLLSGSLLSPRSATLLIGLVVTALLAAPLFIREITYHNLLPLMGFLCTSAALILANIVYREKVEADHREEILAEKEFSEGIINGLPGVFLLYDTDGRLMRWNKRCEQLTEYSPQEVVDLRFPDLVSGQDRHKAEEMLLEAQLQGKAEGEIGLMSKAGLIFPYYFTALPHEIGNQKYLLWFGIDITHFKRTEEARRAVVEHSLQGLAIYQQGRIVFANPAYAQILGYGLDELYAMDSARAANLIYFEDSPRLNKQMETALAGDGIAQRIETRIVRKDGSLRWIEISFSAIDYRDEKAIQAATVEISDRKLMEAEQARLIRELETKNAELERFTYTVSHDLKSPLITIRGFLGFLERDTTANNKARTQADVQRITEATEKMQRLLNDLLGLSRVGRVISAPQDVAFEAIATEAIERVAGQIRQRSVYIKIAEGLPVVRVDRERVIEVVQNLLDNAVKFMGDQWNPTIQIGVRGTDRNGYPVLFVEDNGIGIDPEFHSQVFGLFNKLDPASEGTGIGLALVKRIIEIHGGRVWVESEGKGKGTRFLFTLPHVTAIIQPDRED